MLYRYSIIKRHKITKEAFNTGLIFQCQEINGKEQDGDDALAFAKNLEVLFNDGCEYEVALTS
jgi:hypothetical protein